MDFIKYEMGKYKVVNKIGYNDIIMKNKYTYIESGIEWLGEVPEHWKIDKLRYILTLKNGKFLNNKDLKMEYNIPVYGGNGILGYTDKYNYDMKLLILGRVGAKCGNVQITDGKIWVSDNAIAATTKYSYKYMFYLLKDLNLNKLASETAQPLLVGNNVKKLYVATPPLSEQKAIADFLDKATAKIDCIMELKENQLEKIDDYHKSKIHEAVTKGLDKNVKLKESGIEWLGEIPEHWKVDRLKDLIEINAKTLSSNTPNEFLMKYLDISNVDKNGIIDFDAIRELTFEEAPSRAKRITQKDNVIISSVRTNLQAVAMIDFDVNNLISSTGFFVCKPNIRKRIQNKFLYYFLLTAYSKDYFFSRSVGVSYPAIDDYNFGSVNVTFPPLPEQKAITDYLDRLSKKTAAIKQKSEAQIKVLKKYRKSLIHECVTGKMQVYHEN